MRAIRRMRERSTARRCLQPGWPWSRISEGPMMMPIWSRSDCTTDGSCVPPSQPWGESAHATTAACPPHCPLGPKIMNWVPVVPWSTAPTKSGIDVGPLRMDDDLLTHASGLSSVSPTGGPVSQRSRSGDSDSRLGPTLSKEGLMLECACTRSSREQPLGCSRLLLASAGLLDRRVVLLDGRLQRVGRIGHRLLRVGTVEGLLQSVLGKLA